jgi:hypothetical protein
MIFNVNVLIMMLSLYHIKQIYDELKKGKTILEISRSGAAREVIITISYNL